jgi:hypothetical protein
MGGTNVRLLCAKIPLFPDIILTAIVVRVLKKINLRVASLTFVNTKIENY